MARQLVIPEDQICHMSLPFLWDVACWHGMFKKSTQLFFLVTAEVRWTRICGGLVIEVFIVRLRKLAVKFKIPILDWCTNKCITSVRNFLVPAKCWPTHYETGHVLWIRKPLAAGNSVLLGFWWAHFCSRQVMYRLWPLDLAALSLRTLQIVWWPVVH